MLSGKLKGVKQVGADRGQATDHTAGMVRHEGNKMALLALLFLFLICPRTFAEPADPCTSQYTPGQIHSQVFSGTQINPTLIARYTAHSLSNHKVVLIVNGNGWDVGDYDQLANHLAVNGFIAITIRRSAYPNILDGLTIALEELNLNTTDTTLRVALVGHSQGGRVVVEAAIDAENHGIPISAVIGLAPKSTNQRLEGRHTRRYLVIYGSQDEDVDAFVTLDPEPAEGFAAYDRAGTESTTTCNRPPCFDLGTIRPMDKTMIYIYGADHAGLLGHSVHVTTTDHPQDIEYIDAEDQFCIVKGYVVGYLRWALYRDADFKSLIRGEWFPPSILNITSLEPDRPLRLLFQISPTQRKVIQNFNLDESHWGGWSSSDSVVVTHQPKGALATNPHFVRHYTGLATVQWEPSKTTGYVGWNIPSLSRDATTYGHFSMRVGQLANAAEKYANPAGMMQSFKVVFIDTADEFSAEYQVDNIPPPDLHNGAIKSQSAMQTVRVPVADIVDGTDIDMSTLRAVYLIFDKESRGSLLVDNLEWTREWSAGIEPMAPNVNCLQTSRPRIPFRRGGRRSRSFCRSSN